MYDDTLSDSISNVDTALKDTTQILMDADISINEAYREADASLNNSLFKLSDYVEQLPVTEFPLGTIIAWVSEPDKFRKGNNSISTPLPTGWTRCDGIRIEEGPW